MLFENVLSICFHAVQLNQTFEALANSVYVGDVEEAHASLIIVVRELRAPAEYAL